MCCPHAHVVRRLLSLGCLLLPACAVRIHDGEQSSTVAGALDVLSVDAKPSPACSEDLLEMCWLQEVACTDVAGVNGQEAAQIAMGNLTVGTETTKGIRCKEKEIKWWCKVLDSKKKKNPCDDKDEEQGDESNWQAWLKEWR
eukprot:TRINITY_DN28739_c0_g1_i1.p1 TRINITY_DN28739_c0_g1~~TRINITY_DN28739_c0_g1_i1.p1  ORF type:complete len:142 (+),score=28.52 TRINITY_DN28739_c0_g1_i1:44-469(+)